MDSRAFILQLDDLTGGVLFGLDNLELVEAESGNNLDVTHLLKIALKNEIEAAEIAALWIGTTPEVDVKLGLARQAGDEAKHYRLIEKRLESMNVSLADFHPLAAGYSPMFQFLQSLEGTVPRLAAGQYTRERIAMKRNEQFIRFCEVRGDRETARLYREIIQPDETYHHELGRVMLEKYATQAADQEAAREAALRTLQIAEELRGLAEKKLGIAQIPGC
jgi:1,2-phenylacetyl-CoA epoxidase catalytic subunit